MRGFLGLVSSDVAERGIGTSTHDPCTEFSTFDTLCANTNDIETGAYRVVHVGADKGDVRSESVMAV